MKKPSPLTHKAARTWLIAPLIALAATHALAAPAQDKAAKTLRDAVRTGQYSVARSAGDKATLYVFSDPVCGHCRRLEAELDKLAADYTVHILPVTVIGRERSMPAVSTLLCAPPEERLSMWKQAMRGKALTDTPCQRGNTAAERNNRLYRSLHLPGTPSIIDGNGEKVPSGSTQKAQWIVEWLEELAAIEKDFPSNAQPAAKPRTQVPSLFPVPEDRKPLFQVPEDRKPLFQVPESMRKNRNQ